MAALVSETGVVARGGQGRILDAEQLPDHFERLYRAAYGLCGRREDAEDLVQETYSRVLRRPRLVRADHDLGYLLGVLRNTWLSMLRAPGTRATAGDPDALEFIEDPHGDCAEEALELRAIYGAMQRLPPALRETVVAVDIAGLSYREAARALGTRQGTIMSRLYRARERIAGEIGPRR